MNMTYFGVFSQLIYILDIEVLWNTYTYIYTYVHMYMFIYVFLFMPRGKCHCVDKV